MTEEVVDVVKILMDVPKMSAAPAAMAAPVQGAPMSTSLMESTARMAGIGADIRSMCTAEGAGVWLLTNASLLPAAQVESVLFQRTRGLARTHEGRPSGYGFGTPVGIDAKRVDVSTGVPPRGSPV